jgi:hypothetical protein
MEQLFVNRISTQENVFVLLRELGVSDAALVRLSAWGQCVDRGGMLFRFDSYKHETTLPFCADGCRAVELSIEELNSFFASCSHQECAFVNINSGRVIERTE